jgi:hypothetical protein
MQLRGDALACEALARSLMHHSVVALRKQMGLTK